MSQPSREPAVSRGDAAQVARAAPPSHPVLELLRPLNVLVGFSSMLADVGHDLSADARHRYASHVRDAALSLQRMLSGISHAIDPERLELGEDWMSSGTFRVAPAAEVVAEPSEPAIALPPTEPTAASRKSPRVFIVDQEEAGRELLAAYLSGRGYDLVLCSSGEDALYQAEHNPPDIVLIDPLMPGEDGFHLARMLRASNAPGFVPLIFIPALLDDDSRMRALEAGAEQVVRKPVNRHELRAQVKNLLQLRAHQEELAAQNAQLKSLQRFKDETTAMLVHDLKSPLSAMMMNLDFALEEVPADSDATDVRSALAESRAAGAKLFRMIANLLDIARSDDGRLVPKRGPIDLVTLFGRVAEEHSAEAQARKVTIRSVVDVAGPIDADVDILGRVLANLIENALRYTYAGGKIVLEAHRSSKDAPSAVCVSVTNDGRPISAEWRSLVFEKYAQVSGGQGNNRGLGLYFCRVAVEAHGGTIDVESDTTSGTSFLIVLPQ